MNRQEKLKDDQGVWREGKNQILEAFHHHYRNIYKTDGVQHLDICLRCVPKIVAEEVNNQLVEEVTDQKILEALNSLGSLKASDPDGFNEIFFKSHQEEIKEGVYTAIHRFFEEGELPYEVNEIVVALIPKVPGLESVVQYRPISCCNFLLKMITRIMVSRLKRGFK